MLHEPKSITIMAQLKFTPEEVQEVLKRIMSLEQYDKAVQDQKLVSTLAAGFQTPLLEFTSKAKKEIVDLVQKYKTEGKEISIDNLMQELEHSRMEEEKERQRIGNVLSALEAGEDPTTYQAKIRLKLGNVDASGRQAIVPDFSFPRKELFVSSTMKIGDYTVTLTDAQVESLKTAGRLDSVVEGVAQDGKKASFFVAKDADLNQLRFLNAENVKMPKYVYGIELSEEKGNALKAGKIIDLDIKAKNEVKTVKAYFDPVDYKLKFLSDKEGQVYRTAQAQAHLNQLNQEQGQKAKAKVKRTLSKTTQEAIQKAQEGAKKHEQSKAKTNTQKMA